MYSTGDIFEQEWVTMVGGVLEHKDTLFTIVREKRKDRMVYSLYAPDDPYNFIQYALQLDVCLACAKPVVRAYQRLLVPEGRSWAMTKMIMEKMKAK